jgi:hypothetical protein
MMVDDGVRDLRYITCEMHDAGMTDETISAAISFAEAMGLFEAYPVYTVPWVQGLHSDLDGDYVMLLKLMEGAVERMPGCSADRLIRAVAFAAKIELLEAGDVLVLALSLGVVDGVTSDEGMLERCEAINATGGSA